MKLDCNLAFSTSDCWLTINSCNSVKGFWWAGKLVWEVKKNDKRERYGGNQSENYLGMTLRRVWNVFSFFLVIIKLQNCSSFAIEENTQESRTTTILLLRWWTLKSTWLQRSPPLHYNNKVNKIYFNILNTI